MNKIGIITFHISENYGAMLQAFALRYSLISLGATVDIINYKPKYTSLKFPQNILHVFWSVFRDMLGHKARIEKANAFRKSKLGIGLCPVYDNIESVPNLYSYDKFVVGSDQVWNFNITRDPVYRLLFTNSNQKKYAYAASLGSNKLSQKDADLLFSSIKDYRAISVREKSACSIMNSLGLYSEYVLDPTLLLLSKDWIDQLQLSSQAFKLKKYVFCYCLPGNVTSESTVKLAKLIAKKKNLDVIIVGEREYKRFLSSSYLTSVGVEEFVRLIMDAEIVVTNSFHGTCFSIIFHKLFYTTIANKVVQNNRIVELLTLLQLRSQIVPIDKMSLDLLNSVIDYSDVDSRLKDKQNSSHSFLEKIINS